MSEEKITLIHNVDDMMPHQKHIAARLQEMAAAREIFVMDIEAGLGKGGGGPRPLIVMPRNMLGLSKPKPSLYEGMFAAPHVLLGKPKPRPARLPGEYSELELQVFKTAIGGKSSYLHSLLFSEFSKFSLLERKPVKLPNPLRANPLLAVTKLATAIGFNRAPAPINHRELLTPNLEWPYVVSKASKLFH